MLKLWLKLIYNLYRIGAISQNTWERMWQFGHSTSGKWKKYPGRFFNLFNLRVAVKGMGGEAPGMYVFGLLFFKWGIATSFGRHALIIRHKDSKWES